MAATDHYDLTWVRGEQSVTVFELQDPDGAPQDLTGHTYTFVVRRDELDPGDPLLALTTDQASTSGSLVATPAAGVLTLTVYAAETADLPSAKYALWADPAQTSADLLVRGRLIPERAVRP